MDMTSPRWLTCMPGMVIVFGGSGWVCIVDGGRCSSSTGTMPNVWLALCCDELDTCESVLSNMFGDSGRGITLTAGFVALEDDAEEVSMGTFSGEALSALSSPLCGTGIGSEAEVPLLRDEGSWDGARCSLSLLSSTAARTSA